MGFLGVLAGHVVGLLVPESWTRALGISEHTYHVVAVSLGTVAGVATVIGLVLLIYRRRMTPSVLRVTSTADKAMYPLLGAVIALGIVNTIGVNLLGLGGHADGYDYRTTVAVWFRDVLTLHPSVTQMSGAPWSFQLHALLAVLLLAAWPFTRLVHVLAAPIGYAFRPRRLAPAKARVGRDRPPSGCWGSLDAVASLRPACTTGIAGGTWLPRLAPRRQGRQRWNLDQSGGSSTTSFRGPRYCTPLVIIDNTGTLVIFGCSLRCLEA